MARHRLGGIDDDLLCMVPQCRLDGIGLIEVSERSRRAVGIEIVDLVCIDARVAHGAEHGAPWTIKIRCRHVTSVRAHAETSQFGVNRGATRLGMFVLLQDHHASTFSQHKTIAVPVPRARGRLRIIVARTQGAHGGKAPYAKR